MKARQYAEAIFLATRNANDAEIDLVAERVSTLLQKKGHTALLPAILRELEKIEQKRGVLDEVLVRVSKESDVAVFQNKINADVQQLQATQLPIRVVVDDTLVGGYEVRAHGKRLDRTYKRSLLTLYTNLIINNE
jgi:F0F1-type ATP synthase delta subunit